MTQATTRSSFSSRATGAAKGARRNYRCEWVGRLAGASNWWAVVDEDAIVAKFQMLVGQLDSEPQGLRPPLDQRSYPKVEVSDADLAAVNLTHHDFHPEWNYTITPHPQPKRRANFWRAP